MADEPDTTRRAVLRGVAAAGALTGVSAVGTQTVAATRVDERAEITDPASVVRQEAAETLDHVTAAGFLPDGLSFTTRSADDLLNGADGVAAFRVAPEPTDAATRRYLLVTRRTENAHVRLWIDRDAGTSVADVRTADGQRRLFTDDGERPTTAVNRSGCSNFCADSESCDPEREYVVTYEIGGSCYIDYERTSCGC